MERAMIDKITIRIGGHQHDLIHVGKELFEEVSKPPIIGIPWCWTYVGPDIFAVWPSPSPQCGIHVSLKDDNTADA